MTRDQILIKQLQGHLMDWNPDEKSGHPENSGHHFNSQCCEYDKQGRPITLHLCGLELLQIPSEVWHLSALQVLCLSSNQLSSLPAELGQLTVLQYLDLSYNQLSSLPAELFQLTALQRLILRRNQ